MANRTVRVVSLAIILVALIFEISHLFWVPQTIARDFGGNAGEFFSPGLAFHDFYVEKLNRLSSGPPASLTFECGSKRRTVSDPAAVREFLKLLTEERTLSSHHSNPRAPCSFHFAGDSQIYTLSTDSQRPDEFWLQTRRDARSPFTNVALVGEDALISQFESPALTAWLQDHGVSTASAGDHGGNS
jgi:hypothetical protein